MPEETEPFLEALEGGRSQQEGRFRFHRGSYGERAIKGREAMERLARAVRPGAVIQDDPALRAKLSRAARNAALLVKKAIEHHGLP